MVARRLRVGIGPAFARSLAAAPGFFSLVGQALSFGQTPDGYPLLAAVTNGGVTGYTAGAWQTMMSKRHHVLTGAYRLWESGQSQTFAQVCTAVKHASPLGVPTRIHNYSDVTEVAVADVGASSTANAPYANYVNSQKWFLYTSLTSGSPVFSWFEPNNFYAINYTTFPASDSNGKKPYSWFGDWWKGWNISGVGQAANPDLAGQFIDNFSPVALESGDWNLNGGSDTKNTEPNPNQWVRSGFAAFVAYLRTIMPAGFWIYGNATQLAGTGLATPATTTGMGGLVDVGLLESQTGLSSSFETFGGWAFMVASIQRVQALLTGRANGGAVVHADGLNASTGQDTTSSTRGDPNWQAVHYVTTAAWLLGCYFANTPNQNYNTTAQFDLDEFTGAGVLGSEYLGPPISGALGAIQTAAWKTYSGHPVWRRDFQNGIVLVRPPENIPSTTPNTTSITVPSGDLGGTFYTFEGAQDPSWYDGSAHTSWTFPRDRAGVVLLRKPA